MIYIYIILKNGTNYKRLEDKKENEDLHLWVSRWRNTWVHLQRVVALGLISTTNSEVEPPAMSIISKQWNRYHYHNYYYWQHYYYYYIIINIINSTQYFLLNAAILTFSFSWSQMTRFFFFSTSAFILSISTWFSKTIYP